MSVERISVVNAVKLIETENVQVVDIRDLTAFGSGHLEGAVRVDNANMQSYIENAEQYQPLLVCCYHGHSSITAANFFETQGFRKVYSLDGGVDAWRLSQPVATGE